MGGPRPLLFLRTDFSEQIAFFLTAPNSIEPLDFHWNWHNIRHDDALELVCLRIAEAAVRLEGKRFATVAAFSRACCGIFRAAIKSGSFAAAIKNGLIKASAGR